MSSFCTRRLCAAFSFAVGLFSAGAALAQPGSVDAYGALPALEMVDVSPSGERLAFINVIGESRTLLVTDVEGVMLGGARAGDTKVRSIDWVDENHVLITMTSTEAVPDIGMGRSEITRGQIYDVRDRSLTPVLDGTPGVLPLLFGGPYFRVVNGERTVFVESAEFERGGFEGINLYSIDLDTGRGRTVEEWGARRPDFTIGANGRAVARGNYFADTGRWILQTRDGSFWQDQWSTTALLDQPSLGGLGRTPDTIAIYADHDEGRRRLHEVDLTTGQWSDFEFSEEPDALWRNTPPS